MTHSFSFLPRCFHRQEESSEVLLFRKITAGDYSMRGDPWGEVSSDAKDLVSNLLQVDAERRFTTKQVLESPFMTKYRSLYHNDRANP